MEQTWEQDFDAAAERLCKPLADALCALPRKQKSTATEIRLLVGRSPFLLCRGRLTPLEAPVVTARMLEESLLSLSEYSLHTHQQELRQGYLSVAGGHRAGIAAEAVYSPGGVLQGLRDPNAIVLRIAHRESALCRATARELLPLCRGGLLIAGVPGSGKTTVLCRLAELLQERDVRTVLVDERGELSRLSVCRLTGYPKSEAILMALRVLSPQVILCDELGGEEETRAIVWSLRCGVSVVATAHAADCAELWQRRGTALLLSSGAFSHTALLGDEPVGSLRAVETVRPKEEWGNDPVLQGRGRAHADLLRRSLRDIFGAPVPFARGSSGADDPSDDDDSAAAAVQHGTDGAFAALCL